MSEREVLAVLWRDVYWPMTRDQRQNALADLERAMLAGDHTDGAAARTRDFLLRASAGDRN